MRGVEIHRCRHLLRHVHFTVHNFYIKIMVNKYQMLDNDLHAEVFKGKVY